MTMKVEKVTGAKSIPRRCNKCGRVLYRLTPTETCLLGTVNRMTKVREWRYIREKSGYYCMDCIKVLFPDETE